MGRETHGPLLRADNFNLYEDGSAIILSCQMNSNLEEFLR